MENAHVAMFRASLEGVPQVELSAPFSLRRYRPGDEAAWMRIHLAADKLNTFPPGKFAQQFGADEARLAERQLYLCDGDGREVGTTTAWFGEGERNPDLGRIHWVAIVPEAQGRGLATPLLAAALSRLRELGHCKAYLTTGTARTAALNLYLRIGFVPDIRSDAELAAWRSVRPRLKPEHWAKVAAALPQLA